MSLTALTTSILVILLGQANQPESNIVKDIKRKISIAILLIVPNAATLGSGLMIALTIVSHRDSITSWNAWILGIGLLVSFGCFCVYWVFSCSQVLGRLFAPSQKQQKLSHQILLFF